MLGTDDKINQCNHSSRWPRFMWLSRPLIRSMDDFFFSLKRSMDDLTLSIETLLSKNGIGNDIGLNNLTKVL